MLSNYDSRGPYQARVIKSDAAAERVRPHLIDCLARDKIPGELTEVLGLSPREYQAWTTGGVSL